MPKAATEKRSRGAGKKRVKDPNAPKRPLFTRCMQPVMHERIRGASTHAWRAAYFQSAFFWFCKDERAQVKSKNPSYTVGDIAKALGKKWAVISAEDRAKYAEMAEQDKDRYDREMFAYRKNAADGPEDDDRD